MSRASIAYYIANRVADDEVQNALALGFVGDKLCNSKWEAFNGVLMIDVNDAPAVYQTTEAKMIGRRA